MGMLTRTFLPPKESIKRRRLHNMTLENAATSFRERRFLLVLDTF